jgi:hypothetical protein
MGLESGIRKKNYPGSESATLFVWDFIFGLDMKDLGLVTNLGLTSADGFSKKPRYGSEGKLIWISNAYFGRISVPVGSGSKKKIVSKS